MVVMDDEGGGWFMSWKWWASGCWHYERTLYSRWPLKGPEFLLLLLLLSWKWFDVSINEEKNFPSKVLYRWGEDVVLDGFIE